MGQIILVPAPEINLYSVIPFVPGEPFQEFETRLGIVTCTIRGRWNGSDNDGAGAWYMDVLDEEGEPILMGIKIVLGALLGRTSNHDLFRTGIIVASDLTKSHREATFDDITTRVQVRYYRLRQAWAAQGLVPEEA